MERHPDRGRRLAAIAGLFLLAWPGWAAAGGVLDARAGSYTDELEDTTGFDLLQAVEVDKSTADSSVKVTGTWLWAQPGPTATYLTDTPFSTAGTSTSFVQVAAATPYGESIQLLSKFYSAVDQMDWENDCPPPRLETNPKCLVYPISAGGEEVLHGARSSQVLLVRDVAMFNRCQVATEKTCAGSGDYSIVTLILYQDANRDFLLSGQPYNATWWLRSPGLHPSPPADGGDYNDRLTGFTVSYTYTSFGAPRVDFLGGASSCTDCKPPSLDKQCNDRTTGCPVHLRLADPAEGGSATLYLNTPGFPSKSPYTPYSFSFMPGSLTGAGSPWAALSCAQESLLSEMNVPLCRPTPVGVWGFYLTTGGTSSPPNSNKASSNCGTPAVPCVNSRAASSLYIDGMSITAGTGAYLSPAFDSLSEKTQWRTIFWNTDLNPNGGGVRTPVQFDWRIANSTATFGYSNTTFDSSAFPVVPFSELGAFSLTQTAIVPPPVVVGRYFQYRTLLAGWDGNTPNPPPSKDTYQSCLRYSMAYDGSLSPRVRQFSVAYLPDAGQFMSKPIVPGRLLRWGALSYRADIPGGSSVICDVLDQGGNVIMAGVPSQSQLAEIDPGRYPAIRVRFSLFRNGAAVEPRVFFFKVTYFPLKGCLSLNRNAVRLSFGEDVSVRFCTDRAGMVDVTVHDAAGQLVKRLFHGELEVGEVCQKQWNGMSDPMGRPPSSCAIGEANPQGVPVAPGLYFVTVQTTGGRETARIAVSR